MIEEPIPVTGTDPNATGQIMNQIPPEGMMPASEMVPGIRVIPSQEISFCEDQMKELALSTGALIRQYLSKNEVVSCCEIQNKYEVLLQSKMGLKIAFKCIKSSGYCCKGLRIQMMNITSPAEIVTDICRVFLRAERSCCGGCLCFCRPSTNIKMEENQKIIGGIREPFTCCGQDYEIYDDTGNAIYQVKDSKILKNNEEKGFIKKEKMQFGNNAPIVTTYKISFPLDATPESKILLICSALLMSNFENEFSSKKK